MGEVISRYRDEEYESLIAWCADNASSNAEQVLAVALCAAHGLNEHQISRATIADPHTPSIHFPMARRADDLPNAQVRELLLEEPDWTANAAHIVFLGRTAGEVVFPPSRIAQRYQPPARIREMVATAARVATDTHMTVSGLCKTRNARAIQSGYSAALCDLGYARSYEPRLVQARTRVRAGRRRP